MKGDRGDGDHDPASSSVAEPCIRGTRISVEFLLELVADGASPKDILHGYPQVSEEALRAAFRYAAEAMGSEIAWDVKLPA